MRAASETVGSLVLVPHLLSAAPVPPSVTAGEKPELVVSETHCATAETFS